MIVPRCQMPITDPSLPGQFLDALETAGVNFVVLHREGEIGASSLDGDLDIAVATPPDEAIEKAQPILTASGLNPVIRWPYDVGGTVAFFVATEMARDGMQADLLYDPRGLGRYGVKSDALFEHAKPGERYPVPDPLDQGLYLISKRWRKGQSSNWFREVEAVRRLSNGNRAIERARRLFAPDTADLILDLMNGELPKHRSAPFRWQQLRRIIDRAIRPVGFWVELIGPEERVRELVDRLTTRLERWVPHTGSGKKPEGTAAYIWWLVKVIPIRVRPGIFLGYSETCTRPSPDLRIEWHSELSLDQTARAIMSAMALRMNSPARHAQT